jgi:16S rRNA (cytosine1402-N4)-methyltransferase
MARHVPVMTAEVVEFLALRPGQTVVDATFGAGGHAREILAHIRPGGRLVGIDADGVAIRIAQEVFQGAPVTLVHGDFADLEAILDSLGVEQVDGVLYDLGMSSDQLAAGRGFSFHDGDAALDMRYDMTRGEPAAALMNRLSESELRSLLQDHGEERWAKQIARAIARSRQRAPINTAAQFAATVAAAIPAHPRTSRTHPATRAFLALRAATNHELEALRRGLEAGVKRTRTHGRLVVLSYQSLEHGIVRETFRTLSRACRCPPFLPVCQCGGRPLLRVLTKRAVRPSPAEIGTNPRARSAQLRAAEKVD